MRHICKNQKGFTLVELAISLMIIGLLLGGVLKGTELLGNAKNTQVIRRVKEYDTAVKSFQMTYDSLPGDFNNPSGRIPGCTTDPCNYAGNEDGFIGTQVNSGVQLYGNLIFTNENRAFWVHLAKAGLITGVDTVTAMSGTFSGKPGVEAPATPYEGGVIEASIWISGWGDTITKSNWYAFSPAVVTYYSLTNPNNVRFIDQKMDDGYPGSGIVRVAGWIGTGVPGSTCAVDTKTYASVKENTCNFIIRMSY